MVLQGGRTEGEKKNSPAKKKQTLLLGTPKYPLLRTLITYQVGGDTMKKGVRQ